MPLSEPFCELAPLNLALRHRLREACAAVIGPEAVIVDRERKFPSASYAALAKLELLTLNVPRDLGGSGASFCLTAAILEDLARYGCASTAIGYALHLTATAVLVSRARNNPLVRDLLQRLDRDVLIGALSCSDPGASGRLERPICSAATRESDGSWRVQKDAAWTSSAGFADWYVVQAGAPKGLTSFFVFAEEVSATPEQWDSLGLRGNHAGVLRINCKLPLTRMIGPEGDGPRVTDDVIDPTFMIAAAAAWNGVSLAAIDAATTHVCTRQHRDTGRRVADYPNIQDSFGEMAALLAASRALTANAAKTLDRHRGARAAILPLLWQAKLTSARTAATVTQAMLRAAGGSGLKPELRLERHLRDAQVACLMGPSSEILVGAIGRAALTAPPRSPAPDLKVHEL